MNKALTEPLLRARPFRHTGAIVMHKAHKSPGLHGAADSLMLRDKGNKNEDEMLMGSS